MMAGTTGNGDAGNGGQSGEGGARGGRLRWWLLGALWLALVLTMSWFAIRKSFLWAGDVNRLQQEQAEEFGPPTE